VEERFFKIWTEGGKLFVLNKYLGSVSIFTETSAVQNFTPAASLPESLSYPNPFNPECYIPINVKDKRQNVKCKIYNILGQLVREIECSNVQGLKGSRVYWDGRDGTGLEAPSGVYFYEVVGEGVRRMIVLR
jgi:hypothetical protein